MNFPQNLKYTKSHEWVEFIEESKVRIGITDYAQKELGDIVFVNLPQPGDAATTGDALCDVESVKAVSDIFSPVTGTVSAVNEELLDAPERLNQTPYEAWLAEVKDVSGQEELLSAQEYEALVQKGE